MSLKWEYGGDGEWSALTDIMDPDMLDEPKDRWCPGLCLIWHIAVTENGEFCVSDSDHYLMDDFGRPVPHFFKSLDLAKAEIELANDYVRGLDEFQDGEPVVLLQQVASV